MNLPVSLQKVIRRVELVVEPRYRLFSKTVRKQSVSQKVLRRYTIVSLVILLATTLLWAVPSAQLQLQNADQLIDPYLFNDHQTFQTAAFPNAHSFLLKWPLFFLIRLLGYSDRSFVLVTVATVLATIASLVYVLYRVEKRRLVFSTLCLGLAAVMLMVPPQPYGGALLPVNMAMLATRNLEYIVYIVALMFVVRARRLRDWRFVIATLMFAVLLASDRLFFGLSAVGGIAALVVYTIYGRWNMVTMAAHWLLAAVGGLVTSILLLTGLHNLGISDIANTGGTSPYTIVTSFKDMILGSFYAISHILTNFGANPAFDAQTLTAIPGRVLHHLLSTGGLAYIVNAVLLIIGLTIIAQLVKDSLVSAKYKTLQHDTNFKLALVLLWSTAAAVVVFIGTNHYYLVDARYLSIGLFAIFVGTTVYMSKRQWKPEVLVLTGGFIMISILTGVVASLINTSDQASALNDIKQRNTIIADSLKQHPVDVLVGDYWRVVPIKQRSNKQAILPLETCIRPRSALTSGSWNVDLRHKRFAYLYSTDASLTDFPHCSLDEIVSAYGRPNASFLVAGTPDKPQELLLFYDRGSHLSSPSNNVTRVDSVLPVSLEDLPHTYCSVPTVFNVVAHEDDDLLFMNPDILKDIHAKHCVRTVYITAGDSGASASYWLSREQGSEAAYAQMAGTDEVWVQRIVKLKDRQFITVANPRGNSQVSVIFMHLPDGNLLGQGFGASANQSLGKLLRGDIHTITSVDGQSSYSRDGLVDALVALMHVYQPAEIRTQSTMNDGVLPDHSDHLSVGALTRRAHDRYQNQQFEDKIQVPVSYYRGYPIRRQPVNLVGPELDEKQAIFLMYAKHDDGVCQSVDQCGRSATYGSYLQRQYQAQY